MQRKIVIIAAALIAVVAVIWFRCGRDQKRPPILLTNSMGAETTSFQLYETVLFDAVGLSPRTGYEVRIVDDRGEVIQHLVFSTDEEGRIPATVIWYDIGISPCGRIPAEDSERSIRMTRDMADYGLAGRSYTIRVVQANNIVREANFSVEGLYTRPLLYAADAQGCPKSGFLIGEEGVWVVGKNFPQGSLMRLWAVPAKTDWLENDFLSDQTKQYASGRPPILELNTDETQFMRILWPRNLTSIGSFDIVAEVVDYEFGRYRSTASAVVRAVLAYQSRSGFVVQRRPGAAEPLQVEIAGSVSSPFTFRNTFLSSENVYVGVDPSMQPAYVGQTAKVFIVPDKNDAQWTQAALAGTDLNTIDVTGVVETITVGGICGNCWKTLAWTAPLTQGRYDVVLDFNKDNKYTPGVDLIDSLDSAGFVVADIRVNTISFNYGGSGAITLYDHVQGSNVAAPEYVSANHVVKPAAWVMGGTHTARVEFKAISSVSSAQVWAEGAIMNLNSSASPMTVTFSGGTGTATFTVNNPPGAIGKYQFPWEWKYKNTNGVPSGTIDMGETGTHVLYTTLGVPNAPMTTPWLQVLDQACTWATGQTTATGARTAITAGLNDIGDLDGDIDYVVYSNYSGGSFSAFTFDLTSFLADLGSRSNLVLYCADCAGAFQVYCNAVGLDMGYVVIHLGGMTECLDPIGNGNPGNATDPEQNWQTISWGWHCIGWLAGNIVYDACLHLDGDANAALCPGTRLAPVNMPGATYCGHLMPASGTCNLVEKNVVSVY